MSAVEEELIHALRERLTLVADNISRLQPEQHIGRLKDVSEKIDALQARLPKPIHPQLAHFLQRASYSKALEYLEHAQQT